MNETIKSTEFILIGTGFIILAGICLFLINKAFRLALEKTDWTEQKRREVANKTKLFTGGWVALISLLAIKGFTSDFSSLPPKFSVAIVVPLVAILYITLTGKVNTLLINTPPQWLIYIQTFRIPVELLLWAAFLNGITPVQMTLEGRNLDILSGILAIPVGYFAFKNGKINKPLVIGYNLLGLALLLNIVTVAMLSLPVPFRVFMNEPANYAVAYFPMILLPAVLVPIAYTMHFWSLKQLILLKE